MYISPVSSVFILGIFLGDAHALGINCRGSSVCDRAKTKGGVDILFNFIADIQPCRVYKNGEKIACVADGNILSPNGGFCAFLQGAKRDYQGQEILPMIDSLNNRTDDHCNNCGSVPVGFPPAFGGSNDPGNGILTVNFVTDRDNPCPTGLCWAPLGYLPLGWANMSQDLFKSGEKEGWISASGRIEAYIGLFAHVENEYASIASLDMVRIVIQEFPNVANTWLVSIGQSFEPNIDKTNASENLQMSKECLSFCFAAYRSAVWKHTVHHLEHSWMCAYCFS